MPEISPEILQRAIELRDKMAKACPSRYYPRSAQTFAKVEDVPAVLVPLIEKELAKAGY